MPKKPSKTRRTADYEDDEFDGDNLSIDGSDSDVDPIEYSVQHSIQVAQNKEMELLHSLLNDPKIINKKGDDSTNVINRLTGMCYNIGETKIRKFFHYLEICRRKKNHLMFNERQQEYSGIMLDFDIKQDVKTSQLNGEIFHTLIMNIFRLINTLIDLGDNKITTYVGIIRRPKVEYVEDGRYYKDGIHLLIPGIKVTRPVKRLLIQKLIKNELIQQALEDVKPTKSIYGYKTSEFIDMGSAYVPVFFVENASKPGKRAYKLDSVYAVTLKPASGDPIIRPDERFRSGRINISYEFSLNWEKEDGIIKKVKYEAKQKWHKELRSIGLKKSKEELDLVRNFGLLATNAAQDSAFAEIKDLLDTLSAKRSDDYNSWRSVVMALCNTSTSYKSLAEYFSRKSAKFDMVSFEDLWNSALRGAGGKGSLSLGSIHYWAKQDNPKRYDEVRKLTTKSVLYQMVYESHKEGLLGHSDFAKILVKLLKHKYVVDIPEGERSKVWFEFVLDDDDHIDGELYKWRRWKTYPTSLSNYISETLPNLCKIIEQSTINNYHTHRNDEKAKYFARVVANFKSSMRKLSDRNYKRNIILEAEDKFSKMGFADGLDQDPLIRGVKNGVLKLSIKPSGRPMLIQGYHSHMVSKYTEVEYIPFNPRDELTKHMLCTLRNLFPDNEPDSHEFTMSYLSSTIDSRPKESMFMIMHGSGSNGKSFLVEMHKGAIGKIYGVKMPLAFLTDKNTNANTATPALMQLVHASFAYYSESEKNEVINAARLKEVTGMETLSGRRLHAEMMNFRPKCHHLLGTNFEPTFKTNEHGTWRRLIFNPLKITFKDPREYKINSSNPNERVGDHRVADEWTESPEMQGRYLGFMVYMHYHLYRKYQGKVRNVPHPHIAFETEKYRRRQDSIARFLGQRMVRCVDPAEEHPMVSQVQKYMAWYAMNYGTAIVVKGLIDEFKNSKIGKYIKERARGSYLVGYRFLDNNENPGENEEFAMKNVFELKAPKDNFGIKPETTDEYYQRICREYDEYKDIFTADASYDIEEESLLEYYANNECKEEKEEEEEHKVNKYNGPPPLEDCDEGTITEEGRILPSGIIMCPLEESSILRKKTNADNDAEALSMFATGFDGNAEYNVDDKKKHGKERKEKKRKNNDVNTLSLFATNDDPSNYFSDDE